MYEHILYDEADGIATITLNRPDKLNAYIPEMGGELVEAFRAARTDEAVRVVILTGAGRAFCAGVDLEALRSSQAGSQSSKLGQEDFLRKLPLELLEYPKPVIAAINGHAIGVGVTMTLPCDVRIAAQGAKIGLTFAKLGILPGLGSTHLLPRLIGIGRAQELVLSARVILAPEAAEMGLVNRCVPAEALIDEVRQLATQMAACDPEVLTAAKRALHEGASLGMAEAMANEQTRSARLREQRSRRT
jgi:enoyl-CoA hydratase/carnithine racemase